MRVAPDKPRSTISEEPDGLRIEIPAKPNWMRVSSFGFVILFMLIAVGQSIFPLMRNGAWRQGTGSRPIFPLIAVPLLIWAFAFGAAAYSALWSFFGREVIWVNGISLTIARMFGGVAMGSPKQFNLAEVHNLRVSPVLALSARSQGSPWGSYGTVAFDYGARTYRFGSGLDEAEATMLVGTIKNRFASLR